jgi:branched-chain amino acid transport system ATP-binding protein
MNLLQTNGLSVDFGGLRAVNNVGVEVNEGEVFGIIGPNGAGKTTLFNLLTGFLRPSEGSVFFKGKNVTGLKPYEIAKMGLIRTFQVTSLFPNLTCEENVVLGQHLKSKDNLWQALIKSKHYREELKALHNRAKELLAFLGMEDTGEVIAKNLPFGDERKLEIAIALACKPDLLLLDEPAAGMSPSESTELVQTMYALRDKGITILIVEHNMRVVMEICDRIAVLNFGQKVAEGPPEAIANDPEVISIYLGERKKSA